MPRVFSPEQLSKGIKGFGDKAMEDLRGREEDIQRGKTVELLRRAGKEMYENPIVNTAIGMSPVLGDIQAGVEAYRSAQAGDWGNAGLNAAGMLPFIPMLGKTVLHGSPHSFEKFDLSKIGTGEGAQAYGHGLYFADRPAEAMKYQPRDIEFENKLMKRYETAQDIGDYPSAQVYEDFLAQKTPEEISEYLGEFFEGKELEKAQKAFDIGKQAYGQQTSGLYKVGLPDKKIAQMIDWYKPITEQPEAYAAFQKYAQETQASPETALNQLKEHTGAEAYSMWNNPEAVSQFLHEQGVPGIKYTEQKYVAKPNLTPDYNYVVFDENLPQILERNAIPVNK